MLENAINFAKENKCDIIELTSYNNEIEAHKFYEKNGFINHSIKFKKYLCWAGYKNKDSFKIRGEYYCMINKEEVLKK